MHRLLYSRLCVAAFALALAVAALPLLYARPPAGERPKSLDCTTEAGVSEADVKRLQEAWAKYLGRKVEEEVEIAKGVTMAFVLVPPGKFRMGSPKTEKERESYVGADETLHGVTLTEPFYLGKYEVTQAEYEALTGNNPSRFKGRDKPVDSVNWEEAVSYCRKLTDKRSDQQTYRLPSEAEWEYSCRGGRPASKPFGIGNGESLSSGEANFDGNYPYGGADKGRYLESTSKVGSYKPNALGLYDMHGNVWEWCGDWFADYPRHEVTTPSGPTGEGNRVIRGGGWSHPAEHCRSAVRCMAAPTGGNDGAVGFRVARALSAGK